MMRRGTGGVFQLLFCSHPPRDALDSTRPTRHPSSKRVVINKAVVRIEKVGHVIFFAD